MNDVFKALADPSRRELLDSLNTRNGQTLRELSAGLDMARQSVSKHLGILEEANLVTTIWHGREKLHYLNAEPINAISERWIKQYERQRIGAIADLKTALESITMTETDFVYTTYIEASPELVWRGLTDPAFTRAYWGMTFESDWKVGSGIVVTHPNRGVTISDAEMIVKVSDPFTRLSYGWQAYSLEFTDAIKMDPADADHARGEVRSTVTYELVADGDQTKLTVLHTGFQPGSVVLPDISNGWPRVMAWLKTYLESGRYLEAA